MNSYKKKVTLRYNYMNPIHKKRKDMPNSEEGWQVKLTPEQYKVMREKGTEAPFSGKLLQEKRNGVFRCAACDNALFASDAKFESGTGWPSFDQALPGAVEFKADNSYGMHRTEVLCAQCGSHLGHIFDAMGSLESKGETGLIPALHEVAEKIRQRALVIVVSDFFTDADPLRNALQHLRHRKHDVAIFHLLDHMEMDFQFDRPIRFTDMETTFRLLTEPALIRQQYLRELEGHIAQLRDGCRELNVDYQQVVTDRNYEEAISNFLLERSRIK